MKEWTAAELRKHIGEIIDTRRPRTPLEEKAFSDESGPVGGSGVLIGVREAPSKLKRNEEIEDHGVVPWIEVDYGYSWPILPGTEIEFRSVSVLERELAELRGRLAAIGEPVGYLVVEDSRDENGAPLPDEPPNPTWDLVVHASREDAEVECLAANTFGDPDEPSDVFRVVAVCEPREVRAGQWLDFVAPPQPPVGTAVRNGRLMEWHRLGRGWFYRHGDGHFGDRVWRWVDILTQGAVEIIALGDVDG